MALVRDANGNLVDDGRPATGLAAAAYDPNPAVRNAQAGADARQQAAATGGRAAAMQAQANQPVYGPRNPPMQATPGYSETPAVRAAQANNDARAQAAATGAAVVQPGYSTFTPVRDLQVAADERAQRSAVAAASGVQPAIAPAPAQPSTPTVGPRGRPAAPRGLAAAAATPPAVGGAGQRGAVPSYTVTPTAGGPRGTGPVITPTAQPAVQTPAPAQPSLAAAAQPAATPAQPAMDPQIAAAFAERDRRRANNAVLEQDRANLAGLVGTQATPEQALSPQTLEATNQRIQAALDANRAPAQIPGERGNYNLANTSNVDAQGNITTRLRQPDNIIEGGYGQFGGGRAAQFLASRRAPSASGGMSDASEEVRLRTALTSNNPQERRAAREQLAARQALALDAGATERAGMQLEGEQARAQVAGLAAVQAAEARAAGQQQAAQIQGQYGLQEAQTRAQGVVGAAQVSAGSGSNALSQVRAEQVARQLAVAQAAEEAGDLAGRDRALGISQGTAGRVQTDALGNPIAISTPTGVRPLTPEEIAAIQQASAQYNVRPTQ